MTMTILDHTYVIYDNDSFWQLIFAYSTFLPHAILIFLFTSFLNKREIMIFFYMVGGIFSHVLCLIIKNILKQPRPINSYKTDFGLPSDHSWLMAYFFIFLFLYSNYQQILFHYFRKTILLILFFLTVLVCYGRIMLGVHTLFQITIGGIFGCLWAILWFYITYIITSFHSKYIVHPFCRFFQLRDDKFLNDTLSKEYKIWLEYRLSSSL